ncbi:MAG: peptidase T [Spirochaetaceae bacterium]|nr:MAG: peptidase T [Spirochaetaceae bacterium]
MQRDRAWFEAELLQRFLRYASIHTTSDRHSTNRPSSAGQLDLCDVLAAELAELGAGDVYRDASTGCIVARIPARRAGAPGPGRDPHNDCDTTIGFMAHVDTAPDFPGQGVKPQVIRDYDGGDVTLTGSGHMLRPADYPALSDYVGDTLITSDGTTLLGADDKAGVAEIMTALAWFTAHPDAEHGPLEIIFTTDEEVGRGMDNFPVEQSRARYCYTVDGGDEGSVEAECFTAYHARVTFCGYAIHPGQARGKMVNPVSMAARFVTMLPQSESPEATDGRYGFYCPIELSAGLSDATLQLLLRDFELEEIERRIAALKAIAAAVEAAYPGGSVRVEAEQQYLNMRDIVRDHPLVTDMLDRAIRATGIEPRWHSIRGGTDGSRFTQMGVPTPNIFSGAQNMHSRYEWIALRSMVRAAKTVINLAQYWSQT